ncbi:hypothetical protein [Patulibacter americanus]|uniref:hypothetical protein n=1 Tax=Patulibacter americanus TaxID=588672 RepID=UPI0003B79B63|nr:hypothetical protein [Patulibacter americanus]
MRVSRGVPPFLNRRRVMTAAAVVASGGLVTVAMAAGPVVYSEYTQSGERESRLALPDGAGDVKLPRTTAAATVSPDGRRIAQVGATRTATRKDARYASWLRVTDARGGSRVTVVEERAAGAGQPPRRVIGGRPVWSPDGSQVLVQVTSLTEGSYGRTERLRCVVDTKACSPAGRLPDDGEPATFGTDVVAWQATQGPLRWEAPAPVRGAVPVRCGGGAGRTPMPQATVAPIDPAGGFGAPLRLRGVVGSFESDVYPTTAGVAAVADGTVAFDLPDAVTVRGRLRCSRRSSSYRTTVSLGLPRLRLRTGGQDVVLPTPPGLRRGEGLTLLTLSDGGAVLLTRPTVTASPGTVSCGRGGRVRRCYPESDLSLEDPYYEDDETASGFAQRAWRLRPGARAFERVTTASRAALRTLKASEGLVPADGNAVLAVSEERIERVPLDGGAPTTVVRGRRLALELGGDGDTAMAAEGYGR